MRLIGRMLGTIADWLRCLRGSHKWSGCKCQVCAETRHELSEHCICTRCRKEAHAWVREREEVTTTENSSFANYTVYDVMRCSHCGYEFTRQKLYDVLA